MSKARVINIVSECCKMRNGEAPTTYQIAIWWDCLKEYGIEEIEIAFKKAMQNTKGKLVPAHIIDYMPNKSGHPAPEEAWNHLLETLENAGYLTDEMRKSWGACSAMLDKNQHISARVAFLEKYKSLAKDKPPKWSWLVGDPMEFDQLTQLKAQKLLEMEDKGWITETESNRRLTKFSEQCGQKSLTHQTTDPEGIKRIKHMIADGLNKADQN